MAIRSVALAGMVADTSLYNIDGACVVGGLATDRIPVGTAVRVTEAQPIDGHKVVSAAGITANTAYGVVVRSHYETPDGMARGQEAVNVMSTGRIWMRTDLTSAPAFGSPVLVSETGLATEAGVATGWTYAGGFIPNAQATTGDAAIPAQNNSVDGPLVEVQVKQK